MGSTEEHALPTVEPEETRLLFRLDAAIHRALDKMADRLQVMWSRRHPSDRGPNPDYPDYEGDLNNLENIRRVIKQELEDYGPDIHISNHPRPPKGESWQNKILVGVAVIVIAAVIVGAFTTWALVGSLRTEISMYMESNNKRLDSDEQRIRDTERRLDRGAATPP